MSGVLAVLEQRDGKLHKMALEALAAAQQFAADLNLPVYAAIPAGAAELLTGYKLGKVHLVQHDLLKEYTPDGYSARAEAVPAIELHRPRLRDFSAYVSGARFRPEALRRRWDACW